MPLSDIAIRKVKPTAKPQRLYDERGLYLGGPRGRAPPPYMKSWGKPHALVDVTHAQRVMTLLVLGNLAQR